MQTFPKIKNNEVVLMRVDAYTGHIFDEQLKLCINDSQIVYTIFPDINEAKIFLNRNVELHRNIDLTIYDVNENIIEFIKASF